MLVVVRVHHETGDFLVLRQHLEEGEQIQAEIGLGPLLRRLRRRRENRQHATLLRIQGLPLDLALLLQRLEVLLRLKRQERRRVLAHVTLERLEQGQVVLVIRIGLHRLVGRIETRALLHLRLGLLFFGHGLGSPETKKPPFGGFL